MKMNDLKMLQERLKTLKIIQGPLAGVSNSVFRELIWKYSNPAWVYSEMISCKTILNGTEKTRHKYLNISKKEGPLCLQIVTSDPIECAKACKMLNTMAISMIDLNAGCPVKKSEKNNKVPIYYLNLTT